MKNIVFVIFLLPVILKDIDAYLNDTADFTRILSENLDELHRQAKVDLGGGRSKRSLFSFDSRDDNVQVRMSFISFQNRLSMMPRLIRFSKYLLRNRETYVRS